MLCRHSFLPSQDQDEGRDSNEDASGNEEVWRNMVSLYFPGARIEVCATITTRLLFTFHFEIGVVSLSCLTCP